MDYGETKVLGAETGAVAVGLTFFQQARNIGLIALGVIILALIIRYFWRRNKNIGDK